MAENVNLGNGSRRTYVYTYTCQLITRYLPLSRARDWVKMKLSSTFAFCSILCFIRSTDCHFGLLKPESRSVDQLEKNLKVDEAVFCLDNHAGINISVYVSYDNCYRCSSRLLVQASGGTVECASPLFTDHGFSLSVRYGNNTDLTGSCSLPKDFTGPGTLNVTVFPNSSNESCEVVTKEGAWPYTPLIALLGALKVAALLWWAAKYLLRKYNPRGWCFKVDTVSLIKADLGFHDSGQEETIDGEIGVQSIVNTHSEDTRALLPSAVRPLRRHRLHSLDTFRGLSLVIMIFVNYGGGGYWFLDHSRWNGLTFADLVFPWFVFILGTSAAISLHSLDGRGTSRWRMLWKVLRRFVILFGLGLLLNQTNELNTYRVPGVLQRLAVSYLGISLMYIMFAPKRDKNADKVFAPVREVFNHWTEWIIALLLITVWLMVTFLVHDPKCPPGYMGPGGTLVDEGKYKNCTGGAAGYIDRLIFTTKHIYKTPTCKTLYLTGPYDPEGTLGSLTSIFLAFLGMHAGHILLTHSDHKGRMCRWLICGIFWGAMGTALCEGKQNGGLIPINKNLWSLSFVTVMAGTGYILLAVLYYIMDVKKVWSGTPFVYPGMNSILVYAGSETLGNWFPFSWRASQIHLHLLAQNFTGTALWVVIAYYLFTIEFFVKI